MAYMYVMVYLSDFQAIYKLRSNPQYLDYRRSYLGLSTRLPGLVLHYSR